MTISLELPPDVETQIVNEAARQSLPVQDYLLQLIIGAVQTHPTDARTLRSLSRTERNRLLSLQAEAAAPLYEADLSLPVNERKLTAFTVLDGEPVYDHTP